ncbi:MAG: nucleoside hydrolase [Candidatus Berkelbacteria bacterium]
MIHKIIIDTDIGGDPDDMFALLIALYSPEFEILAIVTGDEHGQDRAKFVKQILEAAGKTTIPVFSGLDAGNDDDFIIADLINPDIDVESLDYNKLSDIILANTNLDTKVTYLGIQSLTNLANLLKHNPNLIETLEIVQMGGAFNYRKPGIAEHNFRLDPIAAKYVLESGAKIKLVLSDTTFKVGVNSVSRDSSIYRELKNAELPLLQLLRRHCDGFFDNKYPETVQSDPLTLLSISEVDLLPFRKAEISISADGVLTEKVGGIPILVSDTEFDSHKFMNLIENKLIRKE